MDIHEELVYQFTTTEDEVEARELLLLLVSYFLLVYNDEKEQFAKDNQVNISLVSDEEMQSDYALYITDILTGMRERVIKKESKLSGLDQMAFLVALHEYVSGEFETIETSETGNARQLAQLQVVSIVQAGDIAAKVYKRWRAHPDCCEVCKALNGTILPIDEPFLVNGQVVELSDGKEFIYKYIDRSVAIAHPNDRCWIEFIIEY